VNADAITLQTAFQLAVSLIAFLGGFLLKSLFSRIRTLEVADLNVARQVSALREELPLNYIRREEFKDTVETMREDSKTALDRIFSALRRIEDKMEGKADKPSAH
jgi:hypothetical protein